MVRWVFLASWFLAAAISSAVDGPFSPEQSLAHFKIEPGLKVELVVAEPMVVDPVAVAWDEKGRMFVVENRGYPTGPGKGNPPLGQIVLLEDTNLDGEYDKRTVYADGLTFPNGVMCWDGGVYVTCAPYLYYFKDKDGDGRADIKQVVFKGFQDLSTTQLRVSHPTLNLDNWVYLTSGLTAAKVTSPSQTNRPPVMLNRVDGRFRPGTDQIEETGGAAQFGQTFDAFGRKFTCSNRNHIQQVVLQPAYIKRNPQFTFTETVEDIPVHGPACRVYPLSANITTAAYHTGYFTSACGLLVYLGTALPESYRGNAFVCEPAGNLIHRDILESKGDVTFVARRAYPTNEFLASPDNWFRPVNLAIGPDGALYVCDMYRKTIEHPDYLPEATRKVTDFESGKDKGRIYRVKRADENESAKTAASAQKRSPKPRARKIDLGSPDSKRLVGELNHSNIWWRMTAHRLLLERRDKDAIPQLKKLVASGKSPESRVHALHLLKGLNTLDEAQLQTALKDHDANVREQAVQLALSEAADSPALLTTLLAKAQDPDARVRFQCALALGKFKDQRSLSALVSITLRDMGSKWTRAAALTAIAGREEDFFQRLLPLASSQLRSPKSLLWDPQAHSDAFPLFMEDLGGMLAGALPHERFMPVLSELMKSNDPVDLPWQLRAIAGFGERLRSTTVDQPGKPALMTLCSEGSSALRERLEHLLKLSAEIALDRQAPLNSRLAAIRLLSEGNFASSGPALEALIDPQEPSEIQTAVIRAFSRMADAQAGSVLVKRERWNSYSPAVRDVVLGALMSRADLLHPLFGAIEAGDIPAWTVNADRRTALMKHKDPKISNRAKALFKDLTPGDRMNVYEEFKPVLALKPDAKNGHSVFQKNCITCHVFAGEGKQVGPDLTGIRNQPAEVLLMHIIVPEYEIMPIYTSYNVETRNGEAFSGLLAGETASYITLRMAQGLEQQIPRSEIASLTTSRLSLMPQEMEKAMSKQELADLIAFLKGE